MSVNRRTLLAMGTQLGAALMVVTLLIVNAITLILQLFVTSLPWLTSINHALVYP